MSKSRHASSPGSIGSGHRLYRLRRGAKPSPTRLGPSPLLEGHICVAPRRVNGFLLARRKKPVLPEKDAAQTVGAFIPRWIRRRQIQEYGTGNQRQFTRSGYRPALRRLPPRSAPSGASRGRRSKRFRRARLGAAPGDGESAAASSSPSRSLPTWSVPR